jgi:hypothetical protein
MVLGPLEELPQSAGGGLICFFVVGDLKAVTKAGNE